VQLFETYNNGAPQNYSSDVDVSVHRTKEDYESGFGRSKFCFVIPGDTTATSQATRAMFAGCVPIFVAADFRELPFSNILEYDKFSIRLHGIDILKPGAAFTLYHTLQTMVQNGTYEELHANVKIARDFFNYHRFGSRSPYGAALVSMYQDEALERG
jgi:hypothetical protein